MNNIPNPDGWLDVFTILAVTAMVAMPSWITARKSMKGIQEVRSQVVNGHAANATNLRQDLDRVIEAIERLGHDVTAIRRDIADEENRRRNHVAELRDELHRKVDDLHKRFGNS